MAFGTGFRKSRTVNLTILMDELWDDGSSGSPRAAIR
jgi:hypothetical protein